VATATTGPNTSGSPNATAPSCPGGLLDAAGSSVAGVRRLLRLRHDVEIGAALLRAAYPVIAPPGYSSQRHPVGGRPDYHLFLPADWRERPDARRDAEARIAAGRTGRLKQFVERLNLRWTPDCGLPTGPAGCASNRRRPPRGTRATIMRVNESTLDAHVRRDVDRVGAREAVEAMLAEGSTAPGAVGPGWWRLAYATDGRRVGFVLPARSPFATLYYLGVVPEHRGHHYSDDLVIEALHIFTAPARQMAYDKHRRRQRTRWPPRSPGSATASSAAASSSSEPEEP
jgi:hypothetical protein